MRSIDRVRRRQRWQQRTDRAVTGMVVALSVLASVTLLPQAWQQNLMSWGCQAASFGVTDCVARLYVPPSPQVRAVPQCDVDRVVEAMVPTVERQLITFSTGSQLERWVERDGDIRLSAAPEQPAEGDPDAWGTAPAQVSRPLPGVELPLSAQWAFPGGEGERAIVAELQQQHALGNQRVSALAALVPDRSPEERREAVRPTTFLARATLGEAAGIEVTEGDGPRPGVVRVEDDEAQLLHDEQNGLVATTVRSSGLSPAGRPARGVLRWTRDETGAPVELVGSWAWESGGGVAVTHLYLPLTPGDGDDLEAWLSQDGGPGLDLGLLLADREPDPKVPLESLVAAAGTVAFEERTGSVDSYVSVVEEQVGRDRRPYAEIPGERSVSRLVRPQPSGAARTLQDVSC